MAAVPMIHASGEVSDVKPLEGHVPSAINPPPGCRFEARCYKRQDVCAVEEPPLRAIEDPEHLVACHFTNV
jgi:oligopeptide/dipeptide ABC transporter ATP-binding protein